MDSDYLVASIKKVAVLGAGLMGHGIAQVSAKSLAMKYRFWMLDRISLTAELL